MKKMIILLGFHKYTYGKIKTQLSNKSQKKKSGNIFFVTDK